MPQNYKAYNFNTEEEVEQVRLTPIEATREELRLYHELEDKLVEYLTDYPTATISKAEYRYPDWYNVFGASLVEYCDVLEVTNEYRIPMWRKYNAFFNAMINLNKLNIVSKKEEK